MSTKTQLTTSNDTKIRNNVALIDKDTDHATFNAQLIGEMFPTTTNVVLATGAFQYNINFTKTGNVCVMQGFVKNNSGAILSNSTYYIITNPLFQAKNIQNFVGVKTISNATVRAILTTSASAFPNHLIIQNSIGSGEVVNFSLTYIVND
jgi:hypothetical protein